MNFLKTNFFKRIFLPLIFFTKSPLTNSLSTVISTAYLILSIFKKNTNDDSNFECVNQVSGKKSSSGNLEPVKFPVQVFRVKMIMKIIIISPPPRAQDYERLQSLKFTLIIHVLFSFILLVFSQLKFDPFCLKKFQKNL